MFFRKRIINKFREKLKKIEKKHKENLKSEKNKISCIFRHDIKTALLAQIRSLELLLDSKTGYVNELQKELISENLNSNYFLLQLVINTLFLLNYEKEDYKLKIEKINLLDELNLCLDEIKSYAQDKEQKIILNAPENINLNADKK